MGIFTKCVLREKAKNGGASDVGNTKMAADSDFKLNN